MSDENSKRRKETSRLNAGGNSDKKNGEANGNGDDDGKKNGNKKDSNDGKKNDKDGDGRERKDDDPEQKSVASDVSSNISVFSVPSAYQLPEGDDTTKREAVDDETDKKLSFIDAEPSEAISVRNFDRRASRRSSVWFKDSERPPRNTIRINDPRPSIRDSRVGHEFVGRRSSFKSIGRQSLFSTNLGMGEAFVYMVLPPDGGHGWFVAFVSFLMQIVTDGIIFSIAGSIPFMAHDFDVNVNSAILISALQISFYYLSGPLTSVLINRFGFMKVAMFGSVGSLFNLLIASYSTNLEMMVCFYSILGGPTLSMIWISSQLIVGYYFEKYRPIANGLSCSGAGVGICVFIKANQLLVNEIGWRNMTRAHSFLMIIVFFLAFAFVEVPPSRVGIMREEEKDEDESESGSSSEYELTTFDYAPRATIKDAESNEHIYLKSFKSGDAVTSAEPNSWQRCFRKCCRKKDEHDTDEEEGFEGVKRYVLKKDLIDRRDLFYTGPAEYTPQERRMTKREIIGRDVDLIEVERPVEAINYAISLHGFDLVAEREQRRESAAKKSRWTFMRDSKCIPPKLKKSLRLLFNVQLFRVMEFRLLFFSSFMYCMALNIPFLYSSSRMEIPDDQKRLIPIIFGLSNFGSRIISGFVAYSFKDHVPYLCGGGMFLGGAAVFVSAFYGANEFWFQILYAILFGIAPGFYSALRAIIYVRYLGINNLTNAFGLISVGMGSGIFLGTALSGLANQLYGSTKLSFVFSGLCLLISGLLKLILPLLQLRKSTFE